MLVPNDTTKIIARILGYVSDFEAEDVKAVIEYDSYWKWLELKIFEIKGTDMRLWIRFLVKADKWRENELFAIVMKIKSVLCSIEDAESLKMIATLLPDKYEREDGTPVFVDLKKLIENTL